MLNENGLQKLKSDCKSDLDWKTEDGGAASGKVVSEIIGVFHRHRNADGDFRFGLFQKILEAGPEVDIDAAGTGIVFDLSVGYDIHPHSANPVKIGAAGCFYNVKHGIGIDSKNIDHLGAV